MEKGRIMKEKLKKIILDYVLLSKDYSDYIDNRYFIPKHIIGKINKKIDLSSLRYKLLMNQSSYSENFKNFLDDSGINYYQEHIVLIRDQELWNSIQKKYGLVGENLYFSLDYYLPEYKLAIEIDSNLHSQDYDRARDEYVFEIYRVRTIRFMEYGNNLYQTKLYNEELINIIDQAKNIQLLRNIRSNLLPIDNYIDIIFQNFIDDYKKEIEILDKLLDYLGYSQSRFINAKKFTITEGELNIVVNKKKVNIRKLEILFNMLFYNKSLTIYDNIFNNSLDVIISVVRSRYNFDWRRFLNKNTTIPAWIPLVVTTPVPIKAVNKILLMTEEDKLIINMIIKGGNFRTLENLIYEEIGFRPGRKSQGTSPIISYIPMITNSYSIGYLVVYRLTG